MNKTWKVVAFLPAKGSSQRIECKNMKLLDGRPLFLHTLEKLVACDFINEVYLDSESDEILNYASYLDYIPLKRDSEFADNRTDGHQMFYNEARQVDADIYIQILGTSPFIEKETIKKGVDILKGSNEYDSVVLVKKEKQYTWEGSRPCYDKSHIPNSIELSDILIETMGMYIIRKEAAHEYKQRYGKRVYLQEAKPIEAIDINYPADFAMADIVAKGIYAKEVSFFRTLASQLSSCIFSDILWEYGCDTTITGLQLNISSKKLMGRANTLALRKLHDGEDYKGIYEALKTYDEVREGEIIIVENECGDYAYFGELNANLAKRVGADGTIIDGVTRDANEVSALGYPVFATGYSCRDVRGVATLKSHNQRIRVQGITIDPGDLIFADRNGVVVIPKKLEKEILQRALQSIVTEKNVISNIINDKNAFHIYEEVGAF